MKEQNIIRILKTKSHKNKSKWSNQPKINPRTPFQRSVLLARCFSSYNDLGAVWNPKNLLCVFKVMFWQLGSGQVYLFTYCCASHLNQTSCDTARTESSFKLVKYVYLPKYYLKGRSGGLKWFKLKLLLVLEGRIYACASLILHGDAHA